MTKTPDQIVAECTTWAAEMRRVVEALKQHADGSQEHAQILEGNTVLAQLLQDAAECVQKMLNAAPKKSQSKARLEAQVAGLSETVRKRAESLRRLLKEVKDIVGNSVTEKQLESLDELFHIEQLSGEFGG